MLMSLLLIPKFSLPAEQMESYSASRANFSPLSALPSFIKASRKSLFYTRLTNGFAGMTSISPLPLLCGEQCPLYSPQFSSVTSAVEESIVWCRPPASISVRTAVSANASSVTLHLQFFCFVISLEQGLGRWLGSKPMNPSPCPHGSRGTT